MAKELDLAELTIGNAKFTLLNSDKAQKALDYIDEKKMEVIAENLLAMYDRLGGAVRLDTEVGQRALALGTFYVFENKCAKKGLDYENLAEESFSDEVKVVRKTVKKPGKKTSVADRIKKAGAQEEQAGAEEAPKKKVKKEKGEE